MSHEIRTPLTSVIGFAEALGEMVSSGEQREFAQAIKSSRRRLLSTLNSVLDYTRIQNQDGDIQNSVLNVATQVSECVRTMQPQAETQGIQLTSEVEIQVEDTGIGIDEALLDHIFEPFLQAEFGPKRQYEGVGLGLAITKRLVHRMNGRMTVESEIGVGSCFSAFFPRVADDEHALERDRSPSEHRATVQPYEHLAGTSILGVEDNDETRQLVQLFLNGIAQVEGAASSAEALSHLEDPAFDGILLDINLGEERTGLELLEIMRRMDGGHSVLIVAFMAYALPGDKERFLKAGFDSYLQKPFTKRQLLRTLDQVLDPTAHRTKSPSRSSN